MTVVDAHAHIGRSIYGETMAVDGLLRQMDQHGVDLSVVTPFTPPDLDFSRANNEVAQAVRQHPDRLIGCIRIDPRIQAASRDEILRGVEIYGFRCVALHPHEQGFAANHPCVLPAIALADQHRLIVHVATGYPVVSTPTQIAVLARQFPHTPFVFGHMGADAYFFDAIKVSALFSNVYLETAGHVLTGEAKNGLRLAIDAAGDDRVIFGSDSPYFDLGVELKRVEVAGLPPESQARVLGDNLLRLLN